MVDNDEDKTEETPKEASVEDKTLEDLEKAKKDLLYLAADFENYKKRVLKERSDMMKYGSESLLRALLDLLDNFERAMSMEIKPDNLKSFADGINMISSEFKNVLARFGVSEIKALGENFDPTTHEAIGTEPTEEFKAGKISKVFTKPYKLHDRIIRPGRVIIAEEPKKDEQ